MSYPEIGTGTEISSMPCFCRVIVSQLRHLVVSTTMPSKSELKKFKLSSRIRSSSRILSFSTVAEFISSSLEYFVACGGVGNAALVETTPLALVLALPLVLLAPLRSTVFR